MPYTIQFADSTEKNPIEIADGVIDSTSTSIQIPGKGAVGYGQAIAESLVRLLENFANSSAPANAVEGQIWYDNLNNELKVYDGTVWVAAGGLKKSTTEPDGTNSLTGDLWVDTDSQQLYLYSGSGWVLVGPEFSEGLTTGVITNTVIGQDNAEYKILEVQVNANIVAIIAFDTFSPKNTINGFAGVQIKPGINLANRDTDIDGINNVKFYGIAEKAENLIVDNLNVPAANFLRGDKESTTTFPLNVQNNTGIDYGINAEMNIGIEGQAGIIQHNIEGSNLDLRVRSGGENSTVIRIDSSKKVGINNEAPEQALDVIGNIQSSGTIKVNDVTQATNISSGSLVLKGGAGIAKKLYVGEDIVVTKSITLGNNDLQVDQPESDLILPDLNNTRNIGSSDKVWRNIYATTFKGNLEGNVEGSVTGKSGRSDRLTSSTTFRYTGDVETVELAFDGKTGGGVKEFDLTIKNTIISGKDRVTDSLSNDDFIIDRISGSQTGLKKISRQTLFSNIAGLAPIGSIMPYVGTTEPKGWKFCNGQELSTGTYNALFQVIGTTYKTNPSTGKFGLPDLRGRFPLGHYNMGSTITGYTAPDAESNDTRAVSTAAKTMGSVSGTEETSIAIGNLPEHEHNLEAPGGEQFFIYNEQRGDGDIPTGAEGATLQTGTDKLSQRIDSSGGIEKPDSLQLGQAMDTISPFQTVSYIIYTGVTS